jgi:hypothetical protein
MNSLSKKILCSFAAAIILTGCATSRSVLDVQVPTGQAIAASGKQVYINSVTEKRDFQVKPPTPDIPSLDPSEDQNDSIKSRAVGRKRNGYGKAMGDMLVKEGETVQSITYKSIREAFVEKGYSVLSNKDQITQDTYIVDATIDKFWAWMNPGFWSITLSSEISTDLTIQSGKISTPQKISVKAADSYQVATDGNWTEIIQKSLKLYIEELKSKLN